MKEMPEFDHLDLPEEHRELMQLAAGDAKRIFLAPMDKGLSGASVWQARWQLRRGGISKLHVFKIGQHKKLAREAEAVLDIASVIEPHFPLMHLYTVGTGDLALLRQEFSGDPEGKTQSLRQYLQDRHNCPSARKATSILSKLYMKRMAPWHPGPSSGSIYNFDQEIGTLEAAFPWWAKKINLEEAARQVGYKSLNASLERHFGLSVDDLVRKVDAVGKQPFEMDIGPVHGDLHAQNVNIDLNLTIYLIDFGLTGIRWRAVDFIVMEAALKFAASPPNALLPDLIHLDGLIERQWGKTRITSCSPLKNCMYGVDLEKIAAAVCVTRRCAELLGAIKSPMQYRHGLIYLTASLASIESIINRVFLFHSLAKQIVMASAD